MDAVIADLIKETTLTSGTGLTLPLTAEANYGRFSNVGVAGTKVYYALRSGTDSELGIGTIQANNTLDRTTPLVTVVSGVYDDSAPSRISIVSGTTVSLAPSAAALNDIISDLTTGLATKALLAGDSGQDFAANNITVAGTVRRS